MQISTTIAAVCMAIAGVAVNAEHTSRKLIPGAHPMNVSTKTYTVGLRETIDGYSYCGGVLVAPKFVATVKSCVEGSKAKFVSVGTHYYNQTLDGEQISVASVHVHPYYRSYKHYNFVLLELAKPSTFKPISLPKADDSDIKTGMMATALGWDKPGFINSDVLLGVDLQVVGEGLCRDIEGYDETNLCAGGSTEKDPCIYYGGGPLIKEQKEGDKDDILIGLYIWESGCDFAVELSYFSRVSAAVQWINSMNSSN